MAVRVANPRSNSFGKRCGQTLAQSPHAVHCFTSTYRAFWCRVTVKLPTKPETFFTVDRVSNSTLGCRDTSTIFGVRMQAEQSRVGKVLSSWAMCPPIDG